jgi:hypothetical protein
MRWSRRAGHYGLPLAAMSAMKQRQREGGDMHLGRPILAGNADGLATAHGPDFRRRRAQPRIVARPADRAAFRTSWVTLSPASALRFASSIRGHAPEAPIARRQSRPVMRSTG